LNIIKIFKTLKLSYLQ